jgi:hypothetical protein
MARVGEREPNDMDRAIYILTILRTDWKIFLRGYVVLTAIGVMIVFLTLLQTKYSSQMILPLSPTVQAQIKTASILDPVATTTHLAAESANIDDARRKLAEKLIVSSELTTGSGIYSITVTDQTPQRAQAVLQSVLAQVIAASKPTGRARASVLQQIETLKRALAELNGLAQTLNEKASHIKPGVEGEEYARALVSVVSDIAMKENKLWELQSSLEGLQAGDVLLNPTLATLPEPRGLGAKLAIALVSPLLLMFGFVLLRHEWLLRSTTSTEVVNTSREVTNKSRASVGPQATLKA